MTKFFTRLWKDESGQGMVEYGLILALIAIAALAFLGPIGELVKGLFSNAHDQIETPPTEVGG
ncbi:MAG: Flp family type IVb pilin [Bacillota bacterium]|jgi:pilus assembly protein Flp/PilA